MECIKKQGEQAMGRKVVSSAALQFLLQLLPSASYLELQSSGSDRVQSEIFRIR